MAKIALNFLKFLRFFRVKYTSNHNKNKLKYMYII